MHSNSACSLGDMGTTVAGDGLGEAACSVAWVLAWRMLETAIEPQKHPCFMRVENMAAPITCTSGGLGSASGSRLGFKSSVSSLRNHERVIFHGVFGECGECQVPGCGS